MEVFFATVLLSAVVFAAAIFGFLYGRSVQSEMEKAAAYRAEQAVIHYQEAAHKNYLMPREELRWYGQYASEVTVSRYPSKPVQLAAPVNACALPSAQQFQQHLQQNGRATVQIRRREMNV